MSEAIRIPLSSNANLRDELNADHLQRLAADPSQSVWVGASAGSGKTKVLADRVLRLLLAGVKPHKILCLTFTRAAAALMSVRLTSLLAHWATCSDDELRDALAKLNNEAPEPQQLNLARSLFATVLNSPGGLRLKTIHSFAQEILRRFPLEAGLSPQFQVLDDAEIKMLWHEAYEDLLCQATENQAHSCGQALDLLVSTLAEGTLQDLLREATSEPERLLSAIKTYGDLSALIEAQRQALGINGAETIASMIEAAVAATPKAKLLDAAVLLLTSKGKSPVHYGKKIRQWLHMEDAAKAKNFKDYANIYLTQENKFRARLIDKELKKFHPHLLEILNSESDRLLQVIERLDLLKCAKQSAAVVTLAETLCKNFIKRKTEAAVLDYDDLINYTDRLLHREGIAPWVLFKLDGGIDHLLVDEAQDTAPAPWRIVEALAKEFFSGRSARDEVNRTLFVVGDEKQSIYSFLKADPVTFARMRQHFQEQITAAGKPYQQVPLNTSFRSAPAILRVVDAVFADDRVRQGVATDAVKHHAFRSRDAGRVEVWPLLKADESKQTKQKWTLSQQNESAESPAAGLADKIAKTIKGWLQVGKPVRGKAMQAGDIMVLVQRRNDFVRYLVRALKQQGVPVAGVDRMKLTDQLAVMDLLALLQFCLLPEDDLNLAIVLRGPLLGCSEEKLMQLAIGRQGSLWQSLNSQAVASKAKAAMLDYLSRWLASADQLAPLAMLIAILNQPCPADTQSGRRALWRRLGADALDPIDELLNAAELFGQSHAPSLQAFLHWLMTNEAEVKREMEQGGNQVRITTIHAAKGLEASVVILPDTVFVSESTKLPKLMWHSVTGLPFYVPREPKDALAGSVVADMWQSARTRQLEEYRRLLYVALTRAADQLYICGWQSDKPKHFERSWYHLVTEALRPLHEHKLVQSYEEIVVADVVLPDAPSPMIEEKSDKDKISLPDWALRAAPTEPAAPKPLRPSQSVVLQPAVAAPQDFRYARGRIIHRLLQSLPDLVIEKREIVAQNYLRNTQLSLTSDAQTEILIEVMRLLAEKEFAPLFGPNSKAEVSLVGQIGDRLISGQVDRLAVLPDSIWLVDYKTNRPPPQLVGGVPAAYLQQLAAYRAILSQIYPDKPIHCCLLWTYGAKLMRIPDHLLQMP